MSDTTAPASGPAAPPDPGRLRSVSLTWGLAAMTVVLLGALWSAVAMEMSRERNQAEATARQHLVNLARAFAEHTDKTVQGADQAIRVVREEYQRKGAAIDLADFVIRRGVINSAYHQMAIIGADGFMVQSSLRTSGGRLDLSDREHFRVHRDGTLGDRLFVSKPVLGRVSQRWSVQLTRRVDAADGRFLGVVVLSLSTDYLTSFYGDVELGSSGVVVLAGRDGVIRAWQSDASSESGQSLGDNPDFKAMLQQSSGTVWAISPVDGLRRLWAYRSLPGSDLLVILGQGEAAVFEESEVAKKNYLFGASILSLLLLLLMAVIVAKARQQEKLLAELHDSNARALAANELKSRFLASVSHELRTPLNGIIGYAELVQHTAQDEETREFGQIIQTSGQHLHRLVNTILDLAKIESGRLQLNPGSVGVREVLEEVRDMHEVPASDRGLRIELAVAPDVPAELYTDRLRLVQVLSNLMHNAVKFTDEGQVRVGVRRAKDEIEIEVVDTGPGVDAALREKLFTRFHAVTGDFTHPMQGAGLGLPLARELAEALGGRLELDLRHAPGARFVLHLPLRLPSGAAPSLTP